MPAQFRSAAVLLGAAALVALQVLGPVHAAPVANAAPLPPALASVQVQLVLDPSTVTPPATVQASGACPISSDISEVVITLDGEDVERALVDAETGDFGPVSFAVPEGTEPADHTVETVVDGETGVCGSTTLTVLPTTTPQPTLVLRPGEVTAPGQVMASGTCPPDWADDSVSLFLDGQQVATTATDEEAQFGPVRVPVAAGTAPADHAVTSECGGSAWLRVGQPSATTTTATTTTTTTTTATTTTATTTTAPTPSTTSTTPTTRGPATTSTSVPAGPGPGGVPPVVPGAPSPSGPPPSGPPLSDPPPSGPAQTAARTPAASETPSPPRPLWPVLGLLAAAALLATFIKGLRDRRGRQWVTEHVATRAAARQPLVPAPVPGETPHGHTVRLHPQKPEWTTPQEVEDAHDRDHRPDDGA